MMISSVVMRTLLSPVIARPAGLSEPSIVGSPTVAHPDSYPGPIDFAIPY